jgi:leucyl-tRNA synthetase
VILPVQVNGKVRFTIEVPASATRDDIAGLLASHPAYPRDDVARLVIVPGKIASIVLR